MNKVHVLFREPPSKFATCTVVSVIKTLVEAEMSTFTLESLRILSSTSGPFILTTVHVPNLALTYRKRITV